MAIRKNDSIKIILPRSKSIRARYITIGAVAGHALRFKYDCDDIKQISGAMRHVSASTHRKAFRGHIEININNSGTALRFLTAYIAARPYTSVLLTGSEQVCNRPISHLVDALRKMGADIQYTERQGSAPLLIKGSQLRGGTVDVNANISSQYVSALMMIAPLLKSDLKINLIGKKVSYEYIKLTAKIMTDFGVEPVVQKNTIEVPNKPYTFNGSTKYKYVDQCDWSAATVWMAAVAVTPNICMELPQLSVDSHQPDEATTAIFSKIGVMVTEKKYGNSVVLHNVKTRIRQIKYNCTTIPDAVPAIVVAACLLGINFKLTGIATLQNKECNRATALVDELKKCGYTVVYDGKNTIVHNTDSDAPDSINGIPLLSAHNDHRMAMALALIGFKRKIKIDNPDVVDKSYPGFWTEYNKFVDAVNINSENQINK